ncbi:type II toxin-antitoxin system Phd/YefM family antitoxin [Amycolatopsis aidingensis]|uniref:type II toxin-antitoxin system Phd/YefM family antitoxin n=1 Tax=Amycolatopsis aidingensis TaxID=2842453 RepID=UPI001C0D297E|nr:type II toxin-antitoxin system prevent-host-death family antitoxin [Amycolatopsis aidingensis]
MARQITQRELRNDTPTIMRAVEDGESFVLTRNGTPVADLVPHTRRPDFISADDFLDLLADLPPTDPATFFADLDSVVDPDPFREAGDHRE